MVEGTAHLSGGSGDDTFVFTSADLAPLTVVYGAGGSDTFDFEADDSHNIAVYILQIDDITAQTFNSLDPSKIEAYLGGASLGNAYGAATDKIVLINPDANDILKYNGQLISDLSRYESETDHTILKSSAISDPTQLVGVDPSNYLKLSDGPGAVSALYTDQWIVGDSTSHWFNIKSGNTDVSLLPGEIDDGNGSVKSEATLVLTGLAPGTNSGSMTLDQYGNWTIDTTSQAYNWGQLSILGFNDGDFGINLEASNDQNYYESQTHATVQSVTEWAQADVFDAQTPIEIYGNVPLTLGGTISDTTTTDSESGMFDTAMFDAEHQRALLHMADFMRDNAVIA